MATFGENGRIASNLFGVFELIIYIQFRGITKFIFVSFIIIFIKYPLKNAHQLVQLPLV